jgi:hypothetical protein
MLTALFESHRGVKVGSEYGVFKSGKPKGSCRHARLRESDERAFRLELDSDRLRGGLLAAALRAGHLLNLRTSR